MSLNKTLQQKNKKHIKPVIIHFEPTTGHDLQLSPVILCRKRRLTWVACVTKTGSEIGIVISLTRKTEILLHYTAQVCLKRHNSPS